MPRLNRRYILLSTIIGTLALIIITAWWLKQPQTPEIISSFMSTLRQQPLIYAVILALVTTVMLPPFLVIIMGGFLYGAIKGAIISSIAYLVGAILSFYLGRYFGQQSVARIAERRPSIYALNLAIKQKGLMIVLLSRLALVIPYNILNVVLGASHVPIKQYVIGTGIGILPVIIGNSILGSTAPGLLNILQGEVKADVNSQWVIAFGVGMIILLLFIVRWSSKQLQHEIDTQNKETHPTFNPKS